MVKAKHFEEAQEIRSIGESNNTLGIASAFPSEKPRNDNSLPFTGGWIGSIDYELAYELLGIKHDVSEKPLIRFAHYENVLVYDHHQDRWHEFGKKLDLQDQQNYEKEQLKLEPSWSFPQYTEAFQKISTAIREGEIYQACLTFPFTGEKVKNTRSLFFDLMQKNPAPMAMYLEQDNRTIMSLSPERFLSWDGNFLETKPIKGTRPRGFSAQQDLQFQLELLSDQKETAELSMITDLLRNDLSKVSKPGTVQILDHQAIQVCPKVIHTYSHIRSETREGITAFDILKACFPGGSISGCPKKRAVEILSELETSARGIYTGCLGYISDSGKMDFNIAIRTLEQDQNGIKASFGGGIVADSILRNEFDECFTKAKTFSFSL